MPKKAEYIQQLYKQTLKRITATPENWQNFLKTAAFQYKYPFADQVLIHAQKPGACACAEIELWNQRFDRWVNRGATGIALIREKGGYSGIRYVFDVADTHGRFRQDFKLWEINNSYLDEIKESLESAFGEVFQFHAVG